MSPRHALCIALMLCHAAAAQAAPKVAVVYSAWSGSTFLTGFDAALQALGWPFEALENKEVARWIERLDEFDLVISSSVGNLENAHDMAPYRDAWLRFLERGGGLLVVDASYGSVLDLRMNCLGDDYRLASAGCAPHTKAHRQKGSTGRIHRAAGGRGRTSPALPWPARWPGGERRQAGRQRWAAGRTRLRAPREVAWRCTEAWQRPCSSSWRR